MSRFIIATTAACLLSACPPSTLTLPDGGTAPSVARSDICAFMPQLVTEAQTKIGDCGLVNERTELPPLTESSCRSRIGSCSQADREQIDLLFGCLRAVPDCVRKESSSFQMRASTCSLHLMPVSSACRTAMTKP